MTTQEVIEKVSRDREALSGLHTRLTNMSSAEYNALIHAIWQLDRQLAELSEGEN